MIKHSDEDLENIEHMKRWIEENGSFRHGKVSDEGSTIDAISAAVWVNDVLYRSGYKAIPIQWLIDFLEVECFDKVEEEG